MSEGCYPQKLMWCLSRDGLRYKVSNGMYCAHCGWPATDHALYLAKEVCKACAAVLMEAAAVCVDLGNRRAARYIESPYVRGMEMEAAKAYEWLYEQAVIREARQMAEARA